MFEKPIDYPCGISDHTDEGCHAAYRWIRSQMQPGDEFTLWVSQKRTLKANDFLRKVSAQPNINIVTKDEVYRANGVVLAMYPDVVDLTLVTQASNTRALAVVYWSDKLETWSREVNAEVIHTFEPDPRRVFALSSVPEPELTTEMIDALERITRAINHNNTINATGFEKDVTIRELLRLHDAGMQLPPKRMAEWAVAHGWMSDNPKHLINYIRKINDGSRPRVSRR